MRSNYQSNCLNNIILDLYFLSIYMDFTFVYLSKQMASSGFINVEGKKSHYEFRKNTKFLCKKPVSIIEKRKDLSHQNNQCLSFCAETGFL